MSIICGPAVEPEVSRCTLKQKETGGGRLTLNLQAYATSQFIHAWIKGNMLSVLHYLLSSHHRFNKEHFCGLLSDLPKMVKMDCDFHDSACIIWWTEKLFLKNMQQKHYSWRACNLLTHSFQRIWKKEASFKCQILFRCSTKKLTWCFPEASKH